MNDDLRDRISRAIYAHTQVSIGVAGLAADEIIADLGLITETTVRREHGLAIPESRVVGKWERVER